MKVDGHGSGFVRRGLICPDFDLVQSGWELGQSLGSLGDPTRDRTGALGTVSACRWKTRAFARSDGPDLGTGLGTGFGTGLWALEPVAEWLSGL